MNVFIFTSEIYLALILLTAGLSKIDDRQKFITDLYRMRLFPKWSITAISIIVPWVETFVAVIFVLEGVWIFISVVIS